MSTAQIPQSLTHVKKTLGTLLPQARTEAQRAALEAAIVAFEPAATTPEGDVPVST